MSIEIEQTSTQEQPVCPVCGEIVKVAPVRCHVCDTPHHWDCYEYNQGCAVYACPGKARKRQRPTAPGEKSEKLKKIPFPQVAAGLFLGRLFVTPLTCVWIFGWELVSFVFLHPKAYSEEIVALCFAMMFLGFLWALFTAERFNVDLESKRITKSKLLLAGELFEWTVTPLDAVLHLEFQESFVKTPGRQLCALLRDGTVLRLAPPFPVDSTGDLAIQDLLRKLESGSTLKLPEYDTGTARRLTGPRADPSTALAPPEG